MKKHKFDFVSTVVKEHGPTHGRNFFTRYDYEINYIVFDFELYYRSLNIVIKLAF